MNNRTKLHELVTTDRVYSPIRSKNGKIGLIEYTKGGNQVIKESSEFEIGSEKYILDLPKIPQDILTLATDVGCVDCVDSLYQRIKEQIAKVAVLPSENYLEVCATYVLASYVYDEYPHVCFLGLLGYPGSGKSTLLEAFSLLMYNPLMFTGLASDSSIFRSINKVRGSLCLDESQKNAYDNNSSFHKMLAVGYGKKGYVQRSAQKGDRCDFTPEVFSVYGPKILAGRGISGDDAILSRFLTIRMKEFRDCYTHLENIDDPLWNEEAGKLRNDLLLYRQRRKLGELRAPNLLDLGAVDTSKLSPRELQVFKWLLQECPSADGLKKVFSCILENQEIVKRRKEEHLEPSILLTIFYLLEEGKAGRLYFTDVVDGLEAKFGLKATCRQVSQTLLANDIDKARDGNGRYILANSVTIAERLVSLSFDDPRSPTQLTQVTPAEPDPTTEGEW